METPKYPLEIILAKQIKTIRNRKNINFSELARYAGITENTLQMIEEERYVPNLPTLIRLAKALRCTLHELLPIEDIQ